MKDKNLVITLITVRSRPHRDNIAFFRGLFSCTPGPGPPGSLPWRPRAGNVKRFLGVVAPGEPTTGTELERDCSLGSKGLALAFR